MNNDSNSSPTHPSFMEQYFISSEEVQALYGYHRKTAQGLLRAIRLSFNKKPKSPVSLEEFSAYTGISLQLLNRFKNARRAN